MEVMTQFSFYPQNLMNGTCLNNFKYNNTVEPKEIVIIKVISAAIIGGIVSSVLGILNAPLAIICVGIASFAYMTANGKNPPSQEFRDNVLHNIKNHLEDLPGFSDYHK